MDKRDLVLELIYTLYDRKGFDDWWDSIDDEIQNQIICELIDIIDYRVCNGG